MQEVIVQIMNQWGYLGIALLIAIENIFPPIPSEVILPFGGFLTTYTTLNILGVIIASTIGSVLGAMVLYAIGTFLTPEKLEKIINGKIGKILRLKMEDVKKAEGWFTKKGKTTVFFCRFVPIVRSLISIPAGMSKMKFIPFVVLTTIGTAIWNTALVSLGAIAGKSWTKIGTYIGMYSKITLIVLIIVFVIGAVIFYYRKNKKSQK